jgi:phage tail-like protein
MPENIEKGDKIMAMFSKKTQRPDPYKLFKFKVKLEGRYVAGFNKCNILTRDTKKSEFRGKGDPRTSSKMPGKASYKAITLEEGITHDVAFESWASAGTSRKNLKKDIVIDVFNEVGQKAISYSIYNCWVSEFWGTPELDKAANATAIQLIKIENEGWKKSSSTMKIEET